jgi:hypothetical protein
MPSASRPRVLETGKCRASPGEILPAFVLFYFEKSRIYENGMLEGFGKEAVVIHTIPLRILAEPVPNPTNPRHQHDP